jgi:hypothetical protein
MLDFQQMPRFPTTARGIRSLRGPALSSIKANAKSIEQASFLSLVADQVGQVVDDVLNFVASQHAKKALRGSE